MNEETAQAHAKGYGAYRVSGDESVIKMFSPDFYDNVGGRSGWASFQIVRGWRRELRPVSVDLHLVTHTEDTVMMWYTARGRHIGNGFPRLVGREVKGNVVTWPQVHIYHLHDGLVEHWAVRDDAALVDSVEA
jgi:hypothetical protein